MKEIKKYTSSLSLGLICFMLILSSCKKDKENFTYDNRKVTDTRKNSTVRVVNLAGYNQVIANGDTLTNFIARNVNDPLEGRYPGTSYFPVDGRLGGTWTVPQSLLINGVGKMYVRIKSYIGVSDPDLTFNVQEEQQPVDYYLLPAAEWAQTSGQPAWVKIPRSVSGPSDASKIKVRVLNLAATVKPEGGLENLTGPMSLTWADGTPVSPATSNILPGKYSDYIELPYGTNQFKIMNGNGIMVPGVNTEVMVTATSTMLVAPNLTYAPIKSYAPGGVYTLVITPQVFTVPTQFGTPGETVKSYQNGFKIINDISEAPNLTYSRMQAVNVMAGMDGIKVLVNGKTLGNAMAYTANTDYETFIIGDYTIQAVDATGTVLANTSLKLEANKNFSIWVHPDASGKPTVTAVPNDLSGNIYSDSSDDGSLSAYRQVFPFAIRFLNFCADVHYLTVTTNNGQGFSSFFPINPDAVNNLRSGVFPIESPYVSLFAESQPYQIMAFRSAPQIVPGTWASDIPVLTGKSLIANLAIYKRGEPNHEPGIYTIVLAGTTKASAPAAQKAKMIVLKHNK